MHIRSLFEWGTRIYRKQVLTAALLKSLEGSGFELRDTNSTQILAFILVSFLLFHLQGVSVHEESLHDHNDDRKVNEYRYQSSRSSKYRFPLCLGKSVWNVFHVEVSRSSGRSSDVERAEGGAYFEESNKGEKS